MARDNDGVILSDGRGPESMGRIRACSAWHPMLAGCTPRYLCLGTEWHQTCRSPRPVVYESTSPHRNRLRWIALRCCSFQIPPTGICG